LTPEIEAKPRFTEEPMRRALLFVVSFCLLLFPATVFAQSSSLSPSDSQTLQALLREVRELRQDVRSVTVASERAQILLSRLQAQQTAVDSAQKEVDQAAERCRQTETRQHDLQTEIKYYSDQDNEDRTPNATDRQRVESVLDRLKSGLDGANNDSEQAQTAQMEAKDRLQIEQGKRDALQAALDQLDKSLQDLSNQPVN
jgi:chromosome segregation ATPase